MEPYEEMKISEIREAGRKVCVFGRVIDREGDALIIDDGSGKLQVDLSFLKNPELLKGLKIGEKVRIFGGVTTRGGEAIVVADVVQLAMDFDEELWEKIRKIWAKVRKYV